VETRRDASKQPATLPEGFGWGARIRTWEWRNQNQASPVHQQCAFPLFASCSLHTSSATYNECGNARCVRTASDVGADENIDEQANSE
jgi:hypothetical protein